MAETESSDQPLPGGERPGEAALPAGKPMGSLAQRQAGAAERMQRREDAIDAAIRRGQEEGLFDNLPGHGKPLQLDDDSGPSWLAFHLLKNSGHAPDWVAQGAEIRRAEEALEERMAATATWVRGERERLSGDSAHDALRRAELEDAVARSEADYMAQVAALNARIDRLNLMAPTLQVQRPRLRPDETLARLRAALGER